MIIAKAAENVALTAADLAVIDDAQPLYLTAEDMIEPAVQPDPVAIAKAVQDVEVAKAAAQGEAMGKALKDALAPLIVEIREASQPRVVKGTMVVEKDVIYEKGRIAKVIERHTEE